MNNSTDSSSENSSTQNTSGPSAIAADESTNTQNATQIVVNTLADEVDGSITDGSISLRDAIALAKDDDTITFDDSLVGGTITLTKGQLVIDKSITIDGEIDDEREDGNITIDANGQSRVFYVDDGNDAEFSDVTLEFLNIEGGVADSEENVRGSRGGGVYNRENLDLDEITISDNSASSTGGGLFNDGRVEIIDSEIRSNKAVRSGGGITNTGEMTIEASLFAKNTASGVDGFNIGNGAGIVNLSQSSDSTVEEDLESLLESLDIDKATLTISDTLFSKNTAAGSGGGIANFSSILNVTDSTFSDNKSLAENGGGGAIENINSEVELEGTTIERNSSANTGGGLAAVWAPVLGENKGSVTINNSTIRENTAAIGGGGIAVEQSSLSLNTSILSDNSSLGSSPLIAGGGVLNIVGNLEIEDSTISNNNSVQGGGVATLGFNPIEPELSGESMTTIRNSTITANGAAGAGGGVLNFSTETRIFNSTITGNTAGQGGGVGSLGLFPIGDSAIGLGKEKTNLIVSNSTITKNTASQTGGGILSNEGTATVTSTIVAANTNNNDVVGIFASGGSNLIGNIGTQAGGFTSEDIIGTAESPIDPLLDTLKDNGGNTQTIALLKGSPAIDRGSSTDEITTDQRGNNFSRVVGSAADIGAFESLSTNENKGQPATIFVDSTTNRVVGNTSQAGETYNGSLFSNTDGGPMPNDVILGTATDDSIYGGQEGSDIIAGLAGNDIIGYGSGDAYVEAGSGDDFVYAVAAGDSNSNNEILLGSGTDSFYATGGNNLVTGTNNNLIGIGSGDDAVITAEGNDFVYTVGGGGGTNDLSLGEGQNTVWLQQGDYTITTGAADDIIGLGNGTDIVNAGNGNNVVYIVDATGTSGGKDILTGAGDDYVQTGAGDDLIDGGSGFNTLFGGSGSDTFTLRQSAYNFVGDFEVGLDKLSLDGLAFGGLTFYQGTGEVAEDAFVFRGLLAIAQVANTQIQDLDNINNFV